MPSFNAARADALLSQMGLGHDWADRPSAELWVGQQLRLAAARALIGQPELVRLRSPTHRPCPT